MHFTCQKREFFEHFSNVTYSQCKKMLRQTKSLMVIEDDHKTFVTIDNEFEWYYELRYFSIQNHATQNHATNTKKIYFCKFYCLQLLKILSKLQEASLLRFQQEDISQNILFVSNAINPTKKYPLHCKLATTPNKAFNFDLACQEHTIFKIKLNDLTNFLIKVNQEKLHVAKQSKSKKPIPISNNTLHISFANRNNAVLETPDSPTENTLEIKTSVLPWLSKYLDLEKPFVITPQQINQIHKTFPIKKCECLVLFSYSKETKYCQLTIKNINTQQEIATRIFQK